MAELRQRPTHGGYPTPPKTHAIDRDLLAAIAWCRLGGRPLGRPSTDRAYTRAEQLGLLKHHPTWHATPQGEGVLIAAGLLKGSPAAEYSTVHVLWASCPRYSLSQFVAAWPDGLVDSWSEAFQEQREEAERFFSGFGNEDWDFWTTVEQLNQPEVPVAC